MNTTNFFPQTCRAPPGYPSQKSRDIPPNGWSWVSRDMPSFLASPVHVEDPPPHLKMSGPQSLSLPRAYTTFSAMQVSTCLAILGDLACPHACARSPMDRQLAKLHCNSTGVDCSYRPCCELVALLPVGNSRQCLMTWCSTFGALAPISPLLLITCGTVSRKQAGYCFESTVSEKSLSFGANSASKKKLSEFMFTLEQIIGREELTELCPRNSARGKKLTQLGV